MPAPLAVRAPRVMRHITAKRGRMPCSHVFMPGSRARHTEHMCTQSVTEHMCSVTATRTCAGAAVNTRTATMLPHNSRCKQLPQSPQNAPLSPKRQLRQPSHAHPKQHTRIPRLCPTRIAGCHVCTDAQMCCQRTCIAWCWHRSTYEIKTQQAHTNKQHGDLGNLTATQTCIDAHGRALMSSVITGSDASKHTQQRCGD
jgi:hypothetical protein